MRFDLADLNLFRHVVEAGSITHGADRSHLALAAASTRIRNMEDALGATLLVRGRQGVTPTQAGRTLLQHARTILRQTERLREDLGAYAGGSAGQVRVLSNTNALTEFLPETLSAFLAAHPNVSVDLEERLSDEIVGLIAEGVADIGVVAGTLDRASALQRFLADKATRAGRSIRLRIQLRSFDGVCRLVERNVGVGIVPETTAHWAAKTMAIKAVQLADAWALRDLSICVRDYKTLPPYARQL